MSRKPTTGGYIAAYCTKCRLDLGHTIIVMDGSKVMRVKCRTCGSEHIYRDKTRKSPTARRTTSRSGSPKVASPKNPERKWESAMEKAGGPEISYSPDKSFSAGHILIHDKFGKGVVLSTVPKKITVLFRDKERILVSSN